MRTTKICGKSINVPVLGFDLEEVHHLHCHSPAAVYIYGIVLVPRLSAPDSVSTSRCDRRGELHSPLSPDASSGIRDMNPLIQTIRLHIHRGLS